MDDGGFVVEMASLIILLLIVAVLVFIGYSVFKAIKWLYKEMYKQHDEDSGKQEQE